MAGKGGKFQKNKLVAKLVTENRQPCVFCRQDVDDEVIYGKLYSLGDIQCHYFCVLLSCCLVQKGRDSEGLFGFLYKDIMAEVERSKKHKCSYCGRGGASLGCSVSQCRKQFHLPCGRQKNVVSLFYGNYKSFCELHAPKQKISDEVMANAKIRLKRDRLLKSRKPTDAIDTEQNNDSEELCVICYEAVQGYPTSQTFWPPCCGRDAWLHRSCLQRMALSAGMHYIKCPLCNDKEQFYQAVCEQGYYLPDRDAAWELEQNAFAEIYERPATCGAVECRCPFGRAHDEPGIWDVKLCLLCGSCGLHAHCAGAARVVCAACRPAAPPDLAALEGRLAELVQAEQEREARGARRGPLMPSRMSLRRTKGRPGARSATSSSQIVGTKETTTDIKTEANPPIETSRQELNLKTPKRVPRFLEPTVFKDLENKLLSPIKMLEQNCLERGGLENLVLDTNEVIAKMRAKFNRPRPLCEKKRIVNEIVEDLLGNVFKEKKSKDLVIEWNTPKKCFDATDSHEDPKENANITTSALEEVVAENLETPDTDISTEESHSDKENHENDKVNNDVEMTENDSNGVDNDESSNSTFQLPPEFIAESEDSLPVFDTPEKLKTVNIEHNSSLDISENDAVIKNNEDKDSVKEVVVQKLKCSFKFSPTDKETLQIDNVAVDVESFKDQYLSEVGREFKCNFNHNHLKRHDKTKLRTVIDFAVDASLSKKRKLKFKEGKRKKATVLNENQKERKRLKKLKKKREGKSKNISLKIKWKDEKERKIKQKVKSSFKQYVLKYSPMQTNKVIEKPENDVSPMKRKYVKLEKSPDNLVQTSIQNFFKVK